MEALILQAPPLPENSGGLIFLNCYDFPMPVAIRDPYVAEGFAYAPPFHDDFCGLSEFKIVDANVYYKFEATTTSPNFVPVGEGKVEAGAFGILKLQPRISGALPSGGFDGFYVRQVGSLADIQAVLSQK